MTKRETVIILKKGDAVPHGYAVVHGEHQEGYAVLPSAKCEFCASSTEPGRMRVKIPSKIKGQPTSSGTMTCHCITRQVKAYIARSAKQVPLMPWTVRIKREARA